MMRNRVKAKLLTGEKVFGVGFTFPLLHAVEIVGDAGFDFIHIEGEHGAWSLKDIEETCMVANAMGLTVHARVPNIHPSTILRFLDRGVQGIMGPHIRSQADAETLVAACRFAPEGRRSFYMSRPAGYRLPESVPEYMAQANKEVWVTALLEDKEAIEENLEGILSVKGLDAVAIGHIDLSQSMGEPGNWEHPRVAEAMEAAWQRISAAGKAPQRRLMFTASITDLLTTGCHAFLAESKEQKP
jgi:2-keto-3-deoxy-L-rhamnonate aldolase RhmA